MTRWDVDLSPVDDLELAVQEVKQGNHTQSDLDRIYRCIKALDAVWAKQTNELRKVL